MKLPNPERAVIEPAKLIQYLLNTEHKRGGHKARGAPELWLSRRFVATVASGHSTASPACRGGGGATDSIWNTLRDSRPITDA